MAPSRLTDSQKQELLARYRAGESSSALAAFYAISPNTVSRTVRTLLSPEAYDALKSARARSGSVPSSPESSVDGDASSASRSGSESASISTDAQPVEDEGPSNLALEDADDFGLAVACDSNHASNCLCISIRARSRTCCKWSMFGLSCFRRLTVSLYSFFVVSISRLIVCSFCSNSATSKPAA